VLQAAVQVVEAEAIDLAVGSFPVDIEADNSAVNSAVGRFVAGSLNADSSVVGSSVAESSVDPAEAGVATVLQKLGWAEAEERKYRSVGCKAYFEAVEDVVGIAHYIDHETGLR